MSSIANSSILDSGALDAGSLSDSEKRELEQFLVNESQKANIQQSIHLLTGMCFKKCVTSKIGAAKLDKYEEPCVQNCVDRFMDANLLTLKHLEKMRGQH